MTNGVLPYFCLASTHQTPPLTCWALLTLASSTLLAATAGVQLSLETPNQPIPLTTPAAPRHGRHPTMPIFADLQTDRPPAPEPLPASAEVYLPPTTTASADLPPLPVPEIPLPPGEGPGSQSGAAVRPTEGITATSSGKSSLKWYWWLSARQQYLTGDTTVIHIFIHPFIFVPIFEIDAGVPRISLGMCPANDRCRYIVTTSLIGWAHT